MKCTHIVPALAVGCIVTSGAFGADVITYDSADRWIEVLCPEGTDHINAVGFDQFNEQCQFGNLPWDVGVLANQSSMLLDKSFFVEGDAIAWTNDYSFPFAESFSVFEVTLTIDETSAFSLGGLMHGRGSYSMTGPGLDLTGGFYHGDGAEAFFESRIAGPGTFDFFIHLEAIADGYGGVAPTLMESGFFLDLQLKAARAADVTGPDGPGHWDGIVDSLDLLHILAKWGDLCADPCSADVTGPGGEPDGVVDVFDFVMIMTDWG